MHSRVRESIVKTILSLVLMIAVVVLALRSATAHEVIYAARLTGPNQSPANDSTGIGFAKITIDFDLFTMRVEARFDDLQGTVTTAHIHAATATPLSGTAGIATQTPSFASFPSALMSGSYDHTFDLSQASSYNPAFIAANGGTVSTASNALFAALAERRAYFDLHSSAFPEGEIRGFLIEPVGIRSLTHLAPHIIHLECFGRAEALNRIESSPDLSETSFTTLATIKADTKGEFQFADTNPGARRFYRAVYP